MSEHRNGPWILASHCAVVAVDKSDGRLTNVRCPGLMCGHMAAVEDGAIVDHDHPVNMVACSWSGVGILDDRASM